MKSENGKHKEVIKEGEEAILTSAHAFGRTKRPIRPASLALSTFSKSGTIVEFKLKTG